MITLLENVKIDFMRVKLILVCLNVF